MFVLPPRAPEQNGCVERGNRTIKAEFYSQYEGASTLEKINADLSKYTHFYNTVRPHQSLKDNTPQEFLLQFQKNQNLESRMKPAQPAVEAKI